jgi:hypothetical protein
MKVKLRRSSTATVSGARTVVGIEVLIASRDGGFDAHYYEPPERS